MGKLSFSFSLHHSYVVALVVVSAIALSSTAVPQVSGGLMFNKLTRRVSVAGDEESGYGLYGTHTTTTTASGEGDTFFDDVSTTTKNDNDEKQYDDDTNSSKNDKGDDEKKEDGGGERYEFDSMEEYDKYVEAHSNSPSRT